MTPKPYFMQITACAKYFNAEKKHTHLSKTSGIISYFKEFYIQKIAILKNLPSENPTCHFTLIKKIRFIVPTTFLFFQNFI
jgi:hypothetical protein